MTTLAISVLGSRMLAKYVLKVGERKRERERERAFCPFMPASLAYVSLTTAGVCRGGTGRSSTLDQADERTEESSSFHKRRPCMENWLALRSFSRRMIKLDCSFTPLAGLS